MFWPCPGPFWSILAISEVKQQMGAHSFSLWIYDFLSLKYALKKEEMFHAKHKMFHAKYKKWTFLCLLKLCEVK